MNVYGMIWMGSLVGLWITNGVDGGLNSYECFLVIKAMVVLTTTPHCKMCAQLAQSCYVTVRQGKVKRTCIAPFVKLPTQGAQVWITQGCPCKLHHTIPCERSPDGATWMADIWFHATHLSTPEGWKAELAYLQYWQQASKQTLQSRTRHNNHSDIMPPSDADVSSRQYDLTRWC